MADLVPTQRSIELHRRLKAHGSFVLKDLAREWNCSTKSIYRTIETMRAGGLQLEFDPIDQRWRYTGEVVEVPVTLITDEDRRALLFSLRAAALLDGLPIRPRIENVYKVLLNTLSAEKANCFSKAMQRVHFAGPRPSQIAPGVWDMVLLSLEARTTMHIHYTDGAFGSNTQRDLDPYALIMRDRRWILVGHCHWAKDIRTFALHRITAAETSESAFCVSDSQIEEYLSAGFAGYPSSSKPQTIRLRIPSAAPPFVKEKCWSETEKRTVDAQGNLQIEFRTAAVWAVERDILAEGGHVEILLPPEARARVRAAATRMAQSHK